jgi:F0F1-type ATP synthase assembly protein I
MKNDSWSLALKIMARISGWIAFPVIIAVFLGKWLDTRFQTEPWLFLATVGCSFLISMYGLVINAMKEFKKIEDEYNKNKEDQDKEKEIKK